MLSGKIPIKPLEQDRQSSPENATFYKFYNTEYEIELILQTKFEFIKKTTKFTSDGKRSNQAVAAPPKLIRLKCANHHQNDNQG